MSGEATPVAKVLVKRFNPATGEAGYQSYEVPYDPLKNVIEVLQEIYEEQDGSLAYRCSCGIGLCSACLIKMNGKMVCACKERMLPEMVLEPVDKYEVIRDLVTEFPDLVSGPLEGVSG